MCFVWIGIFGIFCLIVERGLWFKCGFFVDDIFISIIVGVVFFFDCVVVIILFFM